MKQKEIIQSLLEKGYNGIQAKRLSVSLAKLSPSLLERFFIWTKTGEEKDFESHGLSIKGLMSKYGLKYPAALLSMDWVERDPETAVKAINKGIR